MATVYMAEQPSPRRDVAVKVMSTDAAEHEMLVERFRREADVIAQLQHPHILPIIDFGQQDEFIYIAMRLVRGGTLAQRLRSGPLALGTALEMLRQMGSALAIAHEHGIVHRDLKPNNVLLDEQNNIYLADFGIAKMLGAQQTQLTETHGVVGTPSYMAPEQWKAEPVDARTDVYSLGIMTYQMLTGNLPFMADTPFQMMHHHVNTPPPPLPKEHKHLPETMESVLQKALAKTPDVRFQSAQDFVNALIAAARGQPIEQWVSQDTITQENQPTDAGNTFSTSVDMRYVVEDGATEITDAPLDMYTDAELTNATVIETSDVKDVTLRRGVLVPLLMALPIVVLVIVGAIYLLQSGGSGEDDPPATEVASVLDVEVFESFSGNTMGWDRNESNRYLSEGRYHTLTLPGEGGSGISIAQGMLPTGDFRLEVDLEDLSETASQVTYAVLFRVQDSANYYRYTVTSDGQAGILKHFDDTPTTLASTTINGWDASDKTHSLQVEMVGSDIVLYVDEQVILRHSDDSLPNPGGVGLVAFREGAHIAWDDLRVLPIDALSDPLGIATAPYIDEFSDNTCQWANQTNIDGTMVALLQDGQYRLQVPDNQSGVQVRCATLGLYKDVRIAVTVENLTPQGMPNAYGLIFRQTEGGNTFYVLLVNERGQASLQKNLADDESCQPCVVDVKPIPGYVPAETHELRVDIMGDQVQGYVDGELIIDVTDQSIQQAGIVRLGAFLPQAHFAFDGLILQPIQPLSAPFSDEMMNVNAPLVYTEEELTVTLPEGEQSPAAIAPLPLDADLQNFALMTTIRFEGEPQDQCGFGFRANELESYRWINTTQSGVLGFGSASLLPNNTESLTMMESPLDGDSVEVALLVVDEEVQLYLDGEAVQSDMVLEDPEPVSGSLFTWLFLSGPHDAACHLDNLRVWSLD
jgi:serine/threonine protein kinase